jgi:hypothetical protein
MISSTLYIKFSGKKPVPAVKINNGIIIYDRVFFFLRQPG